MKVDLTDIQRLLEQTAMPSVAVDPARCARLRAALLAEAEAEARPAGGRRGVVGRLLATRWGRVAAAVAAAAVLTTAGWAAQKAYKAMFEPRTTEYRKVDLRPTTRHRIGGEVFTSMYATAELVKGQEDEDLAEIQRLFAAKKYRAVGPVEMPGKPLRYMYSFDLADGRQIRRGFAVRLEEADTWEALQKKQEQVEAAWAKAWLAQEPRRMRRIDEAVRAGRFWLLDTQPYYSHVCRDPETGRKFTVQHVRKLDGREYAMTHDGAWKKLQMTSWADHLRLIAQGRRELLELQTRTDYTYEITLEDGTKTLFSSGGELKRGTTTREGEKVRGER